MCPPEPAGRRAAGSQGILALGNCIPLSLPAFRRLTLWRYVEAQRNEDALCAEWVLTRIIP